MVPLFQRPYVWERGRQWQPLWDDVVAVADRLLRNQGGRAHFLGAIVLDQLPRAGRHSQIRVRFPCEKRSERFANPRRHCLTSALPQEPTSTTRPW